MRWRRLLQVGLLTLCVLIDDGTRAQAVRHGSDLAHSCLGTERPDLDCDAISAQASLDQARHAEAAFWLAITSVFTGIATLIAAGFAAKFAKDAALHTKRSADEAAASVMEVRRSVAISESALQVAKQQSRAELRPYVTFRLVDLKLDDLPSGRFDTEIFVQYVVELTNFGSTPAYNIKIASNIREVSCPFPEDQPPLSIDAISLDSFQTLAQNTPDLITFSKKVKLSTSSQLLNTKRVCLVIIVQYTDIFYEQVYEVVRYIALQNMSSALMTFWQSGRGNLNVTLDTLKRWGRTT